MVQLAVRHDGAVTELPRAALTRPSALERLRRDVVELRATRLRSVARILDLRSLGDPVVVVTEPVPGVPLSAYLARGPLPPGPALQVLGDVARALQMMAWHGVLHGGVTADRVVVGPDGRARITGFGVARALCDTDPDQWSDAYDFAVLAHLTLTGRPPPLSPDDGLEALPWRAADVLLAGLSEPAHARPLPHQVMQSLRRIPAEEWTRRSPVPVPAIAPPPPPDPAPDPATFDWEPEPDGPRWARPPRWLRWATITAGLVLTVGTGVAGTRMLEPWRMAGDAIDVRGISLAAEPGPVAHCPRSRVVLTATLATNGRAGDLTVSWIRPDGTHTTPRHFAVPDGLHQVHTRLAYTFRGREEWSGRAVVLVDGDDHKSARQTLRYVCSED